MFCETRSMWHAGNVVLTITQTFSDLFHRQSLIQIVLCLQGRTIKNKLEIKVKKVVRLKRKCTANILAGMEGTKKKTTKHPRNYFQMFNKYYCIVWLRRFKRVAIKSVRQGDILGKLINKMVGIYSLYFTVPGKKAVPLSAALSVPQLSPFTHCSSQPPRQRPRQHSKTLFIPFRCRKSFWVLLAGKASWGI